MKANSKQMIRSRGFESTGFMQRNALAIFYLLVLSKLQDFVFVIGDKAISALADLPDFCQGRDQIKRSYTK